MCNVDGMICVLLATCTEIVAGFRSPARASAFTSWVCVAEKSPVRRCLGR